MTSIYVCLLHYPMTNKHGEIVTTAVTNLDIHDIARSCRTYNVRKYFIVTPILEQHELVARIIGHWQDPRSRQAHPDRAEALSRIQLCRTFEDVKQAIFTETGEAPEVVLTDARDLGRSVKYDQFSQELQSPHRRRPAVVVFGTGWGVAPAFHSEVHTVLEPIYGATNNDGYNHLSVRSAVAIILDRLLDRTGRASKQD